MRAFYNAKLSSKVVKLLSPNPVISDL